MRNMNGHRTPTREEKRVLLHKKVFRISIGVYELVIDGM